MDDLEEIGELDAYVHRTCCMLLFLSKGYFRSKTTASVTLPDNNRRCRCRRQASHRCGPRPTPPHRHHPLRYVTYKRDLKDVDRCKCEGVKAGFVKISALEGTDEILGATIVGPNAGDMISEITICMQVTCQPKCQPKSHSPNGNRR